MKASTILLLVLINTFGASTILVAQANTTYSKQFLDSLKQVRIKRQQAYFESLKPTRTEFIKKLESYPTDSVFSLDIRNLGFTIFPDISRFTHITSIQASGNQLKELKLLAKNIQHLKVLDIRDNQIEKLKIGKAPELKTIYLASNPIHHIPSRLVFGHQLEVMDLSKTKIRRLPWWMKHKRSLNKLLINSGEFVLDNKNIRRMRRLKTLQLSRIRIDSLPRNFSKLKNLERLTIAYCSLNKLPDNFYKLQKLNTLIFYSDAFTKLPEVCYQLPSLTHLDFYYNHIRSIPKGIDQLKNLEHLYLSFNQISVLPPDIQNLSKLQSFHIHHNNIEIAPQWLSRLTSLEILDLGFNDIEKLPDLSNLKSLKEVDFQENKLIKFPFQLLELPNTQLIFLSNNPFSLSRDEQLRLTKLSKAFADRNGKLILVKE